MDREKVIIKTSIKGIIANVFLATFKAIIGILSNSIAIVLDAVNNLSDVLSAVITIIGAKLGGKNPDREHPYGHGRLEYLSAMFISIIILYAGFTSFIESVKKIIHPEIPKYTIPSIIILCIAIFVKIILGEYYKKIGEKVKSDSLIGSGKDALIDAIIASSTVFAAFIFIALHISLEAWIGFIIAILIIKSGVQMLKTTLNQILGMRIDRDLSIAIKNTINSYENVYGVFDLILNDYGPDIYLGSVHIEIPDIMTADEIDALTRRISKKVYKEHNVIMSAIGIYSVNTQDKDLIEMREEISKIVYSFSTVIQIHGFYINKTDKYINFDVIIDFADKEREETLKKINEKIQNKYSDYNLNITLDYDISD